jgi:hypothetical protein
MPTFSETQLRDKPRAMCTYVEVIHLHVNIKNQLTIINKITENQE